MSLLLLLVDKGEGEEEQESRPDSVAVQPLLPPGLLRRLDGGQHPCPMCKAEVELLSPRTTHRHRHRHRHRLGGHHSHRLEGIN